MQPDCASKAICVSSLIRERSTFQEEGFQQNTVKTRVSNPGGHKLNPLVSQVGADRDEPHTQSKRIINGQVVLLACPHTRLLLGPPEHSPARRAARHERAMLCMRVVFQRITTYKPKHEFVVAQKNSWFDMETVEISASLPQLHMLKSC